MADEEGQVNSGDATATATATDGQTTPVGILDSEGKFTEKWRESLDEDIRNEACFNPINNFNDLAKAVVHAKRMVGKDKVAIPNENSSEGEWEEFHRAAGRPETAGDYNLTRPEEIPEKMFDPQLAEKAQELFHKVGLSSKQAQDLYNFYNQIAVDGMSQQKTINETELLELTSELHREWGNAYDQKVHLGNLAINKGVKDDIEFQERLTGKFGNDPDFIRFSANVGSLFAESGAVDPNKGIPTPSELSSQIAELMDTDAYKNGQNPDHKNMVKRVNKLFEEQAKSRPA